MKILVLNASPKGQNSTTVHTALYLQALHPEHHFTVVPAGQRIRNYEKDFSPLRAELEQADLLLFCYPVYTFIALISFTVSLNSSRPTAWTSRANLPLRSPLQSISTT